MKIKIFSIPATGDQVSEAALNLFTAQHRIPQIDRQLIQNGAASYWSVCVGYFDQQPAAARTSQRSAKVDYRNILSAEKFREYAALREWRKKVAEREGIPVFGIFTNEQMSKIVQLPELTVPALAKIEGIGE